MNCIITTIFKIINNIWVGELRATGNSAKLVNISFTQSLVKIRMGSRN